MQLINVPKAAAGVAIVGKVEANDWILITDGRYTLFMIDAATPQGRANQIADAITQARDAGFQHGLASVRAALGITS